MSEQNPRLAVVSEQPEVSPHAGERSAPDRGRRGPLFWILAGALAVCAVGWLFQAREARELAASLEATRTALLRAQDELRAYDRHLSEVGDRVAVLRQQIDALQALIDEGPRQDEEP
jgi:uncharacterized protein HemX